MLLAFQEQSLHSLTLLQQGVPCFMLGVIAGSWETGDLPSAAFTAEGSPLADREPAPAGRKTPGCSCRIVRFPGWERGCTKTGSKHASQGEARLRCLSLQPHRGVSCPSQAGVILHHLSCESRPGVRAYVPRDRCGKQYLTEG